MGMTEKRFMYFEHKGADYILDNPNTELDFIEMLGDCLEAEEIVDRLNEQDEELQNLKNQIKIYGLFLDQNDLNIEWDLFCTLNHCVNEEDTGCQTCKYMGLVDSDSDD